LDSNQVTEDGTPPLSEGNGGDLPAQENEIRPRSPIHEESQLLNLQFSNMQLVDIFRIPRPRGIVGATFHMLRVPHPLKKEGGTPHLGRRTMKALGFEEVSVEEFFDDIFKSKKKYSYALPWNSRSLPLIKTQLTHQVTKSGWIL